MFLLNTLNVSLKSGYQSPPCEHCNAMRDDAGRYSTMLMGPTVRLGQRCKNIISERCNIGRTVMKNLVRNGDREKFMVIDMNVPPLHVSSDKRKLFKVKQSLGLEGFC